MRMPNYTFEQKIQKLQEMGIECGARDPKRNTGFAGDYMVAEPLDYGAAPTADASSGGFCIVGDDLPALVDEAFDIFCEDMDVAA